MIHLRWIQIGGPALGAYSPWTFVVSGYFPSSPFKYSTAFSRARSVNGFSGSFWVFRLYRS
jgi:hypothetical protein